MPTVGHLTFSDEPAIVAALTPIAQRIAANLADRIKDVTIVVKPRAEMPEYLPGMHARGYWREGKRRILLADDLFNPGEPLEKTLGHEVVHTLFTDSVANPRLVQLLPLMSPVPEHFKDEWIGDEKVGYEASPEECCCVWGSAAIFGFDPPAYVDIYKRSIAKADLAKLRGILLANEGVPTPDPCEQVIARNKALEARIKEISTDLETLLSSLGSTAQKAKPIP
jgi:hypothetical protein